MKLHGYYGKILDGTYSRVIKNRVAECIDCFSAFEKTGSPAIPYISAWQEEEKAMWYEYAGRRFIELVGCAPEELPDLLRASITERRVYKYMDLHDSRIKKEVIRQNELVGSREGLREEGVKKGIVEAVYKISLPADEVVWVKDQATVESFAQDKIHISLGCLTVVTKEMEAEEELLRTQEALRKNAEDLRIAKEVQEEAAAQLAVAIEEAKTAKEDAEKANHAKSEFLAVISHEIRNPMNGIIGTCDLMMETDLQRKQKEYLNIIRSSARSLLGLINDILDFSKIEAGKLDFDEISFSLREVIEEVSDMYLDLMSKKDLEMVVDIGRDVPELLLADPLRLRQVLINLISNAFKFTDRGEISIGVNIRNLTADRVSLIFCVRDTGIGIAPRHQSRLFDVFTQVNGSTTRKYGGTGLGLAICKRIVEMMNGRIWVESRFGTGSAFYFTGVFKLPTEKAPSDRILPDAFEGLKVLVVEDNPSALRVAERDLQSFGFLTESCDSVETALEKYESAARTVPYDLIVMDIGLPGMDGVSGAERIKREASAPPIVLTSTSGRQRQIQRAISAGVDSFLIKPVKRSMLLDTVMEIFGVDHQRKKESDLGPSRSNEFSEARLLLVEDNPTNQRIASEILKMAGIRVDTGNNGLEAVEAVRNGSYDAVLMDIQMPVMDGIEATRVIRGELERRHLPIIAMTAHAMPADREKCIQAGMDDYIIKPIDRKELFAALRKHIGKKDAITSETNHSAAPSAKKMATDGYPGLNVQDGVKRLGGAFPLYVEILGEFCADKSGFADELRRAVHAGNYHDATIQAHALKGAAANVSAVELSAAAKRLEAACRDRNSRQIDELLPVVAAAFDKVKNASDALASRAVAQSDGRGGVIEKVFPGNAAFYKAADALRVHLDALDPVASEASVERMMDLAPAALKSDLLDLSYQVRNYHFETAKGILSKMTDKAGS